MKKIVMFLVCAALLSFAAAGFAQVTPGSITISPTIGGYMFEGNQDMDNSLSVGLRAGYNFTKYFGIEGYAHYVPTDIENSSTNVDYLGYGLEGLYHFMPDSKFVPFFAIGVGGVHYSNATEDTTDGKRDKITADYGVGVKYFVTENIALRADVRHVIPFDGVNNDLLYTVGLSFAFGGAKKVVEAKPEPAPVEEVKPAPVVEEAKPEIIEKGRTTLNVEFDFDKATIKKGYYKDIDDLVTVMKQYPDLNVEIDGHTDSIGTAAYNKKLSQKRADAIKKYMVEKGGIDAKRLTAVGYGEDKPIASNKTKEGRQKNRRVEAVADYIIKK
ncbi:MAG: OmpA family protein [Smithellaceae bacterium]|jgi:OOP family OmpA-OmpF porin